MPLDKLCIVFIFFALQYGGILRSGIEDAYQFKMSHREIRQYDKTRSLWYRILLPYSHMKYCGAPRHMRLFQALRALNLAAIIAMLVFGNVKKCAVGKYPKSEKPVRQSGGLLCLHPLPVLRRRQSQRVARIDPNAVVVDKNIAENDRFDLFSR